METPWLVKVTGSGRYCRKTELRGGGANVLARDAAGRWLLGVCQGQCGDDWGIKTSRRAGSRLYIIRGGLKSVAYPGRKVR